jgi:hypothetical protein
MKKRPVSVGLPGVNLSNGEKAMTFESYLESLAADGETVLWVRQKPLTDPPTYHVNGAMKATWPAYRPNTKRRHKGEAWYANTASYIEERMSDRVSASAANCEYVLVMVLDDIGTKSKTPPIEPTWKMETSPGNYQWGYAFDFDHQPKKGEFAAAILAIADAGYTDPGACNPVRNFRLPGSVNTKQGREAFESVLVEFHPDRFFTLDQICQALGVTPGEALNGGPRPIRVRDDGSDDVFAWLNEQGMVYSRPNGEGWAGVLCPNAGEHTDGSPEGRYMPATRAFCCLHGHCTDWDSERFMTWVASQGGPTRSPGIREELIQARLAAALPTPTPEQAADVQKVIEEVERKEAGRVEQAGWFERYAYVLPDDSFFDMVERRGLKRASFNALYRHIQCFSIFPTAGGKSKRVEASVCFDENRQALGAKVLQGTTYAPGASVICTRDGDVFGNRWVDARPAVSGGGDPSRWLEHVERLIPERFEREHVLDTLAFKLQNPGVKINHAILLHGTQGCGKDTLFAPLLWAVGGKSLTNVSVVKNEEINRQFEYFLEAEVIVFNELYQNETADRRALENRLKPIIAAPPAVLMMDRKHEHPVEVQNQFLVLAMSNRRDAIALSKEDRRWFVCWTNAPIMSKGNGKAFWDWFEKGGGFEACANWLWQRDVSAYDPGATPPWTEGKEVMLGAGRSLAESWLVDMIEQERGEFAAGIISGPWGALCDRLQGIAPGTVKIVPQNLLHALAEAGWIDWGMCHSKTNKTKRHIWTRPGWVGTKGEARDAVERPAGAGGPLSLVAKAVG